MQSQKYRARKALGDLISFVRTTLPDTGFLLVEVHRLVYPSVILCESSVLLVFGCSYLLAVLDIQRGVQQPGYSIPAFLVLFASIEQAMFVRFDCSMPLNL